MPIFENDQCLLCHDQIVPVIGWGQLFSIEDKEYLCKKCEAKLDFIKGETCRKCNRPFETLDPQYRKGELCLDCVRWERDENWSGCLESNTSILNYNEYIKEVIALFKFRGDYVISKVFSKFLREKIKQMDQDMIVLIPLSEERLYERGFNQAEALIKEAKFSAIHLLKRTHTEKQSKKSREERIHYSQVFQLTEGRDKLSDKRILLIDDIYTTGSTLYHAAKVLKEAGAKSVSSLTLARG